MPDSPPPMTATSVPCSVAGIWPRPAGWARKLSYAYGKSGLNMVIGGCCSSCVLDRVGHGGRHGVRAPCTGGTGVGARGRDSDEGPVEAGAAVLQVRVGLAGRGEEDRVDVAEDQLLGAPGPGTGGPVGSGEYGRPRRTRTRPPGRRG